MSTRITQKLHPSHKYLNQIAVVVSVLIGSWLMGSIPLIYGFGSTNIQGDNFIVPTEAELWSPVGETIE